MGSLEITFRPERAGLLMVNFSLAETEDRDGRIIPGTAARPMRVHNRNLEAVEVRNHPRRRLLHVCSFSAWMATMLLGSIPAWAAAGDPPVRVARLAHLTAHVSLEPAGTNQWTQAIPNAPLTTGDCLYVNYDGHAELQMGMLSVRAWELTDLCVENLTNHATQLAVAQGSLHVRTFALSAEKTV